MGQLIGVPSSWKGTTTAEQSIQLIDYGVMLRWRDMRSLRRAISETEEVSVIRHFARRLVERHDSRLQMEILVESALIWLANASSEKLLHAFLEELFATPGCDQACWPLVEISLTAEVSENSHDQDIFEMAVALICELGISIQEYERAYPGDFDRAQPLLDHIATYLLSVSNANSACIRLSLLHYFGVTEHGHEARPYFNRIMSRFGHTVLDNLFNLLFRKRSEAVALQYLLENLPYVLTADRHSQKIVHETFKYYMLKQPERFSLFIQAIADELVGKQGLDWDKARQTYMQHLAVLLKVASDVNHRQLGREFMLALVKFEHSNGYSQVYDLVVNTPDMRAPFRDLFVQLHKGEDKEGVVESVAQFRSSKRGRKPSFARVEGVGTMHQVTYLGAIDVPKAS